MSSQPTTQQLTQDQPPKKQIFNPSTKEATPNQTTTTKDPGPNPPTTQQSTQDQPPKEQPPKEQIFNPFTKEATPNQTTTTKDPGPNPSTYDPKSHKSIDDSSTKEATPNQITITKDPGPNPSTYDPKSHKPIDDPSTKEATPNQTTTIRDPGLNPPTYDPKSHKPTDDTASSPKAPNPAITRPLPTPLKEYTLINRHLPFNQRHFEIQHNGSTILYANSRGGWIRHSLLKLQTAEVSANAAQATIPDTATLAAFKSRWTSFDFRLLLRSPDGVSHTSWWGLYREGLRAGKYRFYWRGESYTWKRTHRRQYGSRKYVIDDFKLVRDLTGEVMVLYVNDWHLSRKAPKARIKFFVEMDKELEVMALAGILGLQDDIWWKLVTVAITVGAVGTAVGGLGGYWGAAVATGTLPFVFFGVGTVATV